MLNELLLSLEKRFALRTSTAFNKTNKIWNNGDFNWKKKIGAISYLVKLAHKTVLGDSYEKVLTHEEWFNFYIDSGQKRRAFLDSFRDGGYPMAYDIYYGRTLKDIYNMAKKLKKLSEEKGISITLAQSFNFCIIHIIDESYLGYTRSVKVIKALTTENPEYSFVFANNFENSSYGLDIIVLDEDSVVVSGLQIKPISYLKRNKEYILRAVQENEELFMKCFLERRFSPQYLFVDRTGNITKPFPEF